MSRLLPILLAACCLGACASRPQVHTYTVRALPAGTGPVTVSGTVSFAGAATPVERRALPAEFSAPQGPVLVDLACDDPAAAMTMELDFKVDGRDGRTLSSPGPHRHLAVVEERRGDDFSLRIEARE